MSGEGRPGRNDPCPCGSGRKYKRCCLARDVRTATGAPDPEVAAADRLSGVRQRLMPDLDRYLTEQCGAGARDRAWEDFCTGVRVDRTDTHPEEDLFGFWRTGTWRPRPESRRTRSWPGPAAALYLQDLGARLDAEERELCAAFASEPFSFHAVESWVPGRSLVLRDLLTLRQVRVIERKGSVGLQRGDVIYCRVITAQGVSVLMGCGAVPLDPLIRTEVMELRAFLGRGRRPPGPDDLLTHERLLRRAYLTWRDHALDPPPPKLVNTDDEPLEFHEMRFGLSREPRAALLKLASLSRMGREVILEDVRTGPDGAWIEGTVQWMRKKGPLEGPLVLGTVRVLPDAVLAETNSGVRAIGLRSRIEARLKDAVQFQTDTVESAEHRVRQGQKAGEEEEVRMPGRFPDLGDPEQAELLGQVRERYHEKWMGARIPVLRGRTPRQSARTPAGRELLEALLCYYERQDAQGHPAEVILDMVRVRRELGME